MSWNDIIPAAVAVAAPAPVVAKIGTDDIDVKNLGVAAGKYRAVGQTNKADTCEDIARKALRFGSWASDKQRDFARNLIAGANGLQQAPTRSPSADDGIALPRLYSLMMAKGELHLTKTLKLSRKRDDTLVWIIMSAGNGNVCVGKIVDGKAVIFAARCRAYVDEITATLLRFEENPLEAAKAFGREYGRCCVCNRELSDPDSIAAGIGPICAGGF